MTGKANLAVLGATGVVGRHILEILKELEVPYNTVKFLSSKKSAGSKITFDGKEYTVEEATPESFDGVNVVLASAGGSTSKMFAPEIVKRGGVIIDNSSAFRMDKDVPLVVPEVNPEDIEWNHGIIANPNCSTIQAMLPLKALKDAYGIKRVVYSTYQAVSGAGMQGIADLEDGLKGVEPKKFPYPIAGNCLPHIDVFLDNGYTKEEVKMINETQKILHDDSIKITATAVRVPVLNCHAESINIELEKPYELEDVVKLLESTKGIVVYDDTKELKYPTQLQVSGKDEVYVGRIRRDFSIDNGLNLWVVGDNIRKGAALNAIQIAEEIIK